MSPTPTLLLLECLPDDILRLFLCSCDSLKDLYAFIRASPIAFRVFLPSKKTILCRMARSDVGPVIRDYIALAYLYRHPINPCGYEGNVLHFIHRYREYLTSLHPKPRLPVPYNLDVIRAKRTTKFFVDMYARSRLFALGHFVPAAGTPLTELEFQRLSQAFVRYQIFTILFPRRGWCVDHLSNREAFAGLFKPWEMEEISTVHTFLLTVSYIQRLGVRFSELEDFCLGWETESDKFENLARFQSDIEAMDGADKEIAYDMHFSAKNHDQRHYWAMFNSSHQYLRYHSYDVFHWEKANMVAYKNTLFKSEASRPPLITGSTVIGPPYAWVDGMGGMDCLRWGVALLPCSCDYDLAGDCEVWWKEFRKWRSLGFLFWDEERIELLKPYFTRYKSDWINDACKSAEREQLVG